jgi:hypothetical protein
VRAAPAVSRAKLCKKAHTSIQVQRKQSGLPCAMVLTVSFGLSPVIGLSCHRRLRKLVFANLTPASRRQDHTTSPSALAPFVKGASASTASRPTSVTIASAPHEERDGRGYKVIRVFGKSEYFCERGWTGCWVICPSGRNQVLNRNNKWIAALRPPSLAKLRWASTLSHDEITLPAPHQSMEN